MDVLLWIVSVALILIGLAGTVLPALPGNGLMLGGIALAAWIDDFTRISWGTVGVVFALTVIAIALDFVAGLLGAKKVRASWQAIVGAAVGTVAGLFMGIVGVLFMPLVGATAGEYIARRDHQGAVKVGVATWIGTMLGMVAKVVIAFIMIGIFVVALLI